MSQPYLTSQNIWRGLVTQLRTNATLQGGLSDGHYWEGIAPTGTDYPHAVWTAVVPGVKEDTWNSRMYVALADVVFLSRSSVEASNLDQLAAETLDEASLPVIGQQTLICHRVGDIRTTDRDEEGRRIYRIGGSYEIVTSQVRGVRNHSFTVDAVIV